jgi:hypothetical protein
MKTLLAAAVISSMVATAANAGTLFYGGNTSYFFENFAYGAYNDSSAVLGDNFQAYDNFAVPVGQSWSITSIFANVGDPAYSSSLAANWFVRTGMTATSLGTLAASGTDVPGAISNIGGGALINGNLTSETLTVSLASALVLSGGQTYWFALQPISTSGSHTFVGGTTSNANAVGGPLDDFSYIVSSGAIQSANFDLSAGVIGTESPAGVPEPASLALLGAGLLGIAAVRRMTCSNRTDARPRLGR